MGYDNGQLISLYAQAFKERPLALYKETVDKTIAFFQENLCSPEGGFYAALDADSLDQNENLIEGAYYVWKLEEIKKLFPKDHSLISAYYSINDDGYWEDGNYVLRRMQIDEDFAKLHKLSVEELKSSVLTWNSTLLKERNKRSAPRLDDKIICSWNALLTSGLLEAYTSFRNSSHLNLALKNLDFIERNFVSKTGKLKRISKGGVNKIDGFLEDYAAIIKLFIDAYETVFNERYLLEAEKITEVCIVLFKDKNGPLFYFSPTSDLVLRTKETSDNVIPSSNAVMAENLVRLSSHLLKPDYKKLAEEMIMACKSELINYPRNYSYWLLVGLRISKPSFEIVAVGPDAKEEIKELQMLNTINCSWAAAEQSRLPLFQNRGSTEKTMFYLCRNNQCELPLEDIEAVKQKLEEYFNS